MLQEDKGNTKAKINGFILGGSYEQNMPQNNSVRNLTTKEIKTARWGMLVAVLLIVLIGAACFFFRG